MREGASETSGRPGATFPRATRHRIPNTPIDASGQGLALRENDGCSPLREASVQIASALQRTSGIEATHLTTHATNTIIFMTPLSQSHQTGLIRSERSALGSMFSLLALTATTLTIMGYLPSLCSLEAPVRLVRFSIRIQLKTTTVTTSATKTKCTAKKNREG